MGSYYKNETLSRTKFRKYVNSYVFFLSFAKKCSNKYGKKIMDTATKTGIDAPKHSI